MIFKIGSANYHFIWAFFAITCVAFNKGCNDHNSVESADATTSCVATPCSHRYDDSTRTHPAHHGIMETNSTRSSMGLLFFLLANEPSPELIKTAHSHSAAKYAGTPIAPPAPCRLAFRVVRAVPDRCDSEWMSPLPPESVPFLSSGPVWR